MNLMTFIWLVFDRYLGMDFFKFYHNDLETINIIYDQQSSRTMNIMSNTATTINFGKLYVIQPIILAPLNK